MNKDIIYFVGCAEIVKLFHKAIARNFNVHFPEEENRLAGSNIVTVKYSVISIDNDFWSTSRMLRNIAEEVIFTQEKHNAHSTANMVEYKIMKG